MPAARRRRRLDRMNPQLIRDSLQFLNINVVHESGNCIQEEIKGK
jgi:hypothetical protein